ncbi:helix-turn-helix domain-containing protein [Eisenbergiella sp.]
MSKAGVSFENIKSDLLLEGEFKEEYEKLQPRYEVISQIIEARKEQNMTQSELVKRVGTQNPMRLRKIPMGFLAPHCVKLCKKP